MNVFELRNRLVDDYSSYVKSFIRIRDERIRTYVEERLKEGLLWPEPLIQMNPSFAMGEWIDDLVEQGVLHQECRKLFRIKPSPTGESAPLRLYKHQADAGPGGQLQRKLRFDHWHRIGQKPLLHCAYRRSCVADRACQGGESYRRLSHERPGQ